MPSINTELFASIYNNVILVIILGKLPALIVFLAVLIIIIHIPKLHIFQKIYNNRLLDSIKNNNFITSILKGLLSVLIGALIIFSSWTLTSIVFEVFSSQFESMNWGLLFEPSSTFQITLEQQKSIIFIEQILEFFGLFIVSIFLLAGIFFMLSGINLFFRKISYLLFSLVLILYLFMFLVGGYTETAKSILEKYPAEKIYNSNIDSNTDLKAISPPLQ